MRTVDENGFLVDEECEDYSDCKYYELTEMEEKEMTREEAKRVLEFDLDHTYNDESKEALRIAIKALELLETGLLKDCESCKALEPCDAVSRKAVENILPRFRFKDINAYREAKAELDNLPSV